MKEQLEEPNSRVFQLATGFAHTSVMFALVSSGIIEQLRHQSKSLGQIAGEGNFHADVLGRVLRYARGIGIISLHDRQYSLTKAGRLLLKDVPGSIHNIVLLVGSDSWQRSWNNLNISLQTGKAAFSETTGKPFFEYIQDHPQHAALFDDWMTAKTQMIADAIPQAYDFAPFETVCDIGGGQGLLLKSVLLANPYLSGILYDMNKVVQNHVLEETKERVVVEAGDIFEGVPRADVLMMKQIIHDWDDQRATQILGNCKKVMGAGTKLLIIEQVLGHENNMNALFMDLHMQVMNAGKERSAPEFEALLHRAGLKLSRIIPTQSPVMIIEAAR